MVNHGTFVNIRANHDTWNACQDHGQIMARSWQDNHGKTCELLLFVLFILFTKISSSPISEYAVVITLDITFIYRKKFFLN